MTILWGFFSVFPANAGMILERAGSTAGQERVPRECGDDPKAAEGLKKEGECSPRMRG